MKHPARAPILPVVCLSILALTAAWAMQYLWPHEWLALGALAVVGALVARRKTRTAAGVRVACAGLAGVLLTGALCRGEAWLPLAVIAGGALLVLLLDRALRERLVDWPMEADAAAWGCAALIALMAPMDGYLSTHATPGATLAAWMPLLTHAALSLLCYLTASRLLWPWRKPRPRDVMREMVRGEE